MKSGAVLSAALAALIAAYCCWCAFGPVRRVALGQPIRHDDFVFTVERVTRAAQTNGAARYTVMVLVQNEALRVPYEWNDGTAYVIDARGRRYAPVTGESFTLGAGQSRVARIEFRLPSEARKPVMRFWDDVLMGDALDGNAYGRSAVAL